MKLVEIFKEVPDFRRACYVSYALEEILVIALCAVLSGADDFVEIAAYGKEKESFLGQFLELPNGLPSHDVFNRVFQNMDTASFEKCLVRHSKSILNELSNYEINIDGKILRATGKGGKKNKALCIVSAWASEQCVSLGQSKVAKKSNEKTAIPKLIEAIDVEGALVTIDAMGCDQATASLIRNAGGDYLLALKKNQKNLYEEAQDWMLRHKEKMDNFTQTDYTGGRIEQRKVYVCTNLTFIDECKNWQDSKAIIMVQAQRSFKNDQKPPTLKTRFYISSATQSATYFAAKTRGHWSIENNLHWQLDVVFNEDRQRVREGNAAQNMCTLRKIALQLLNQNKGKKSIKTTRKTVAWSDEKLLNILKNC